MATINNQDHLDDDSEALTRQQYRAMQHPDLGAASDEPMTRQAMRESQLKQDELARDQLAQDRSKRLAHRLDLMILFLCAGIGIVLIVLFFIN